MHGVTRSTLFSLPDVIEVLPMDARELIDPNLSVACAEALEEHANATRGVRVCTANSLCRSWADESMDEVEEARSNCHNYLDGPPYLRCSCPHGLVLLQALYPSIERANQLKSNLTVWVDWRGTTSAHGACSLSVRRRGIEVARAVGECSQPLRVSIDRRDDSCAPITAKLCWETGHRALHVTPPPTGTLNLDGLVLPPHSNPRGMAALEAQIDAKERRAPPLTARMSRLARGFGVEIELLTEASAWPLPPTCSGQREADEQREEQMRSVVAKLHSEEQALRESSQEAQAGRGVSHPAEHARATAALDRCELWRSDVDVMIQPTPEGLAALMLESTAALLAIADDLQRADATERCMRMLQRGYNSRKSEFQSPRPPHELRFSRGAAFEIGCFVDGVLASTGAAAASITSSCHSATAVHVHVNVTNAASGGTLLGAMQICDVVLGWIRFDLVTQRFARPWMWGEPSCVPLYATGAELGTLEHLTWQTVTEAEVEADIAHPAAQRSADDPRDRQREAMQAGRRKLGDVPAFVLELYALVNADDFDDLSEADKLDALFGIGSPGSYIGRYCSLNLSAMAKYGTLEVRRFHGTLDSSLLVRWAAFCVAFVEAFAATPSRILSLPTAEAALEALQLSQEMASTDELLACMAGFVDPMTASYFEAT